MTIRVRLLFALLLCAFSLSAQRYREMIDAGTYTVEEIRQEAEAYFKTIGHGRGTGYKPFRRWEYVARREMNNAGVKISNFELSTQARAYRTQYTAQQRGSSFGPAANWHQLGPTYWNATSGWNPGLGRITSIGIEKDNPDHYIVGSPSGGVWKTLDDGNTWTPLTDDFSTVDVYALEISPFDNNFYLWGSTSGKIFKSVDGGATWAASGKLTGSGRVSRIQFHPTDPNIVYAVSESNGLFRSTDGGNTWAAVPDVSGIKGYDVQFKPGDPNTIYFSGVAVFRSIDGGASFTQINGFGTENNNYKRMGVSPANPNVVYVLEANGGKFGGFYKSADSGATFTELVDGATINYFGYSETGDDDSGQAPRNMAIGVNPNNADEVHIGGVHTWKSVNGGQSFSLTSFWTPGNANALGVGYNHADIGIIKFFGNKMFVSSDGGIFVSTDGANTFQNRSVGLGIREFYKIGVSKTDPNVVSGGSQDNGTSIMRGPNRQWVDWLGADGMETFVDWSNSSIIYGTSQYGSMYRSDNQGTTRYSLPQPPGVEDGAWITPFEQDPQVPTTLYVAFADVWKSTDGGNNWTKISDFDDGNFDEMKIAPSDNQRIYVARGSDLFTTPDGGTTWPAINKAWGGSTINYIAVHPHDPQRVLVVTSSTVYQSVDAGVTWTNIGAGLPGGARYCAAWEDRGTNGIYVGGFGFVAYTNDSLPGQWMGFFDGLPNVRVYELEINYVSNTIFAGTYGRGLWESELYQALPPVADFTADIQSGCPGVTVQFNDASTNYPASWQWNFPGGNPATSSLQNPVVTYNTPGSYSAQLIATNAAGQSNIVKQHTVFVYDPAVYSIVNGTRCDSGEIKLSAKPDSLETLYWYDSPDSLNPVHTGDTLTVNIGQSATYYVSAGYDYAIHTYVGAKSNTIGGGANHNGGYYLLLDAYQPFLLKSARVYAAGAGNRRFRLLDANQNILIEKTVFVPDGESRITLNMDIPQGYDLRLGCDTVANLYRNSDGAAYPYTAPGLMQIKGSTAGAGYYYYLYDLELEGADHCEGDRVPVQAIVNHIPDAPLIATSEPAVLCPNASLDITLQGICPGCTVKWSNGATDSVLTVSTPGIYSATLSNGCGESAPSNEIEINAGTLPDAPLLAVTGNTVLCPNLPVNIISASNICPDCSLRWSTGKTADTIAVLAPGNYYAVMHNVCGDGPASDTIAFTAGALPPQPGIEVTGPTLLCPGVTTELQVTGACPDCQIQWSDGQTTSGITVSSAGFYTVSYSNVCGQTTAADTIEIVSVPLPATPDIVVSGSATLCPGASVALSVENVCPDCSVLWSDGTFGDTLTVSAPGVYSAVMHNVCGESMAPDSVEILAAPLPDTPQITAGGPTALCPGASVELSVSNVCTGCSVAWSNGESEPDIEVTTPGVYFAVLSNNCGSSQPSNEITVSNFPPFVPVIDITNTCHLSAPAGSNYQWYFDGAPIPGATTQQWTADTSGTYSVTMDSPDGCAGASAPVAVEACISSVQSPDAFFNARIYPNPTHGQLFLEINPPRAAALRLDLYAADGKFAGCLFDGMMTPGRQTKEITLPGLPVGVYRYRLTSGKHRVEGNLVVERR